MPTNGIALLLHKAGGSHRRCWHILATPAYYQQSEEAEVPGRFEAATLPRVLNQVDLALINTNYALEAKLNPSKDALVIEGSESPYVNILVSRAFDNKDSAALKKLAAALTSPDVKKFIRKIQGRSGSGILTILMFVSCQTPKVRMRRGLFCPELRVLFLGVLYTVRKIARQNSTWYVDLKQGGGYVLEYW